MGTFKFDPDELLKEEIVLDKIEVARRQINAAIRMFFYDSDPVAFHTVTAAAHEVVRGLALAQGIEKSIKDSPLIEKGSKAEFIKAINLPQNFFKHADKDPKGSLAFSINGTPFFVLDAIILFAAIGESLSREMRIFLLWAQLRFPDLLCLDIAETDLARIRETTSDQKTFKLLGKVLLEEEAEVAA